MDIKDQWVASTVTIEGNVIGVFVYEDQYALAVVGADPECSDHNEFQFFKEDLGKVIAMLQDVEARFTIAEGEAQ